VPSPLAHFLFGLTAHVAASPAADVGWRKRAVVTVAAAIAPDVDLVFKAFGLAIHQGASHSVGAAVLAGVAVASVSALARWPRPYLLGLAATIGWCSHIALDLVNVDTHPPIGLQGLWPFSTEHYKFAWPIFLDIGRTLDWKTVRHDALALAWEAALLCPLLVALWRGRTARGR
jgi:membrane-bound metal-dependent hydrolase YbcI (DUF457 family)